ncbi:Hypothetical protein R9X50_00333200 [Acrodontium crateriforme]|uniref:DUF1993 domain-containing protein n=1 Tax=Acrodontium crateriforme TaxID=150365 RepID=A0AAQ3M5J0_9PEZI|nr:Hypothetical protein R9X50_00333200 [Acrodontium crateriforme]
MFVKQLGSRCQIKSSFPIISLTFSRNRISRASFTMSSVSLYDFTVPVAIKQLESLRAVLKKAEQWCKDNGKPESTITEGRLAPDMLPLTFQVQAACNMSAKCIQRLEAGDVPFIEDNEKTFAELDARIAKNLEILKAVKPEALQGKESAKVEFKAGPAELKFTGLSYVQQFLLPNLFFHTTTAYAIVRAAGVTVGKFDFLGAPIGQ